MHNISNLNCWLFFAQYYAEALRLIPAGSIFLFPLRLGCTRGRDKGRVHRENGFNLDIFVEPA